MDDSVKNFIKEVGANEELSAKIAALESADNAIEKMIAVAAEHGYALTEDDLGTVTEEDFREGGSVQLSLDDLESVAGGIKVIVA